MIASSTAARPTSREIFINIESVYAAFTFGHSDIFVLLVGQQQQQQYPAAPIPEPCRWASNSSSSTQRPNSHSPQPVKF
ncbi:hypothetical protein OEZ85_003921 [Tetradesmus obliquus]|uniref:Uncharacterized protein n=1 Tax=Tetradesmus obliquus TaxID=3088 RepID=A0ABY8UCT6_TETOB|nr:hypothetical protein OEZ85_003921 [Tetradesmus obliquus]